MKKLFLITAASLLINLSSAQANYQEFNSGFLSFASISTMFSESHALRDTTSYRSQNQGLKLESLYRKNLQLLTAPNARQIKSSKTLLFFNPKHRYELNCERAENNTPKLKSMSKNYYALFNGIVSDDYPRGTESPFIMQKNIENVPEIQLELTHEIDLKLLKTIEFHKAVKRHLKYF